MKNYDVLVVGGGTAGVIAAIQSAKAGAKTLIVEKSQTLGGTMIGAGVYYPGIFHAWGKQIIAGIGWDLVKKCVEENGDRLQDFTDLDPKEHWKAQVTLNPCLLAMIFDEAVKESGCDVLFDTMLAQIEDGNPKTVTVCTRTGLEKLSAKVVVDCTGDANAVTMAGFEVEKSASPQPSSYLCTLTGYDNESLDYAEIEKEFEKEVAKGNFHYDEISYNASAFSPDWIRRYGGNNNHVHAEKLPDPSSESKTETATEGRLGLLKLYRFFKKQKGLENLKLDYLAPEVGVRETVRIVGRDKITLDEFLSGKVFDEAVCYSYYPVDLHTADGNGLKNQYFAPGVVGTVPKGALLPKGSKNFVVAGRCISSDQLTNSVVRVQATCMATGQAAGALAALAAIKNVEVADVKYEDLRRLLTENGAILP